jgi:hypothetical protein
VEANTPNTRFPHLWIVLRIDQYPGTPWDQDAVTVTSVFTSEEAALADVDRLNALTAERGGGSTYFTRIGRLKDRDST